MRVIDLFAGIGGFTLGLERSGHETIRFCEIDPFAKSILRKHWPDVPIHDDVTTCEFEEGEADVVTGGFPCQDVSLAGRRAGLAGERSGLYRELVRALRVVRPKHGILENVAALLSDGMGTVLGDLAESGFDAEWDCVPACAIGAPHERDRVWIVAHANDRGKRSLAVDGQVAGASEDGGVGAPAHPEGQQVGTPGQPRLDCGMGPSPSDAQGVGRGSRGPRRPPDSFARVRVEARRNSADPYGARLAFREGFSRDARSELPASERGSDEDGRGSLWPDEPALSGVDDGVPHWMDRVRVTGNAIIPRIAELIGLALKDQETAHGQG